MAKKKSWDDKEYGLEELETYLESTLTEVNPRPAFIDDLRFRLSNPNDQPKISLGMLEFMVFGLAGLITSILIIVTGVRATKSLVGAMNKRRMDQRQPAVS